MTIDNESNFLLAAISIDRTFLGGPYGGYADVVTSCSARFDYEILNILFAIPGVCNPNVDVKEWFYTNCECNEGRPCICRIIPEQLY